MALKTKINLRSFKGVMRSKVAGIPLPLVAVGGGVLAVIYLRRRRAAEGTSGADQAGYGDSYSDGAAGGTGGFDTGGGGYYGGGGGGYFGFIGGGGGGGDYPETPGILGSFSGASGTPGVRSAGVLGRRIAATKERQRTSAAKQKQLTRSLRGATGARKERLQARQSRVAARQRRQSARVTRLKSRRRMLAGKSSSTGA